MSKQDQLLRELEAKFLNGDTFAAHDLGKIATPEAIDLLLKLLKDASGIPRRSIIQSLPLVPQIETALIELLGTNHDDYFGMVDIDIVMKLAGLQTSTALEAVRTWTQTTLHRSDAMRFIAFEGVLDLSRVNDTASLPLFRQCLQDSDPSIRGAAISAVGDLKDIDSVPTLIALLADKTENPLQSETLLCDTAAESLGEIADERAVEPILEMILTKQTGMHPNFALRALGKISGKGFDTMLRLLETDDTKLRADVAYSFGLVGDHRAIQPLQELLKVEQDEHVRYSASDALRFLR